MAGVQLSEGALQDIMKGSQPDNPIMQVLSTKRIASTSLEKERYRVLLSDGRHHISFAMLTTQMNHKVTSGDLTNNCIIKMLRYVTSVINNSNSGDKRVLIIMDLEVLVPGSQSEKIGNPLPLSDTAVTTPRPSSESRPVPRQSTSTSVQNSNVSTTTKFTGTDMNMALANQMVLPIASLSPYQNRWVIKARVTFKSAIRTWSNARGEGKLFSLDLCDESGEIRATAFKDQVDKFYDYIEVDKVYFISKCILKVANKQFTTIKNDYEMTFTNDTLLQDCPEDDSAVPKMTYNFVSIDQVVSHDAGGFIDIIGVCKSTSDLQRFVSKAGKDLIKREVSMVDQSNTSVVLTLWGNDAETFDGSSQPILAIKGARVGEFGGGKTISLFGSSQMKVNPDIEESHRLRGWFDNGGCNVAVKDISARSGFSSNQTPWASFRECRDNPEWGKSEKGDFFQAKVTVLSAPLNEKSVYKSCVNGDCKRKVIDLENGLYRCEKCNIESANFTYRLLGRMQVADSTGSQWVSMFSDESEKVFGKKAQEIGEMIGNQDNEALSTVATDTNFKEFMIKCRSKVESFNDEQRLKTVAVRVEPVNYKEYNSYLLNKIRSHLN